MVRKKRILWAAVIALGFLILSYFLSNIPFSIKGEKMLLREVELVKNYFGKKENRTVDSVLFVNVTYDKVMLPVTNAYGRPIGHSPVTDRQKLLRMLQFLKEKVDADSTYYKFILLDVFFAEGMETEWDSALFATIASMPRIIVPSHEDIALADSSLMGKSGLASFHESFWVYGFTKYPYYWKAEKTLPVKMYEEMTGRRFKKFGPFYSDGWRLANGSEFLPLDITANTAFDDNRKRIWYNLGVNLLDDSIPELNGRGDSSLFKTTELTKDKYIVVGSFQGDDMVSTFKGLLSGAVVNYDAFCSLMKGRHRISFSFALSLYASFFLVSFLILNEGKKREMITMVRGKKGLFWRVAWFLLCPLFKYPLILHVCFVFLYLAFDRVFEVLLISTAFYFLSIIVKFKNQIQTWQEEESK